MKNAFLDSDGVLKCHGFVEENEPGDTRIEVPSDFNLEPRKWKLEGNQWIEHKEKE